MKKEDWFTIADCYPGEKYVGKYLLTKSCKHSKVTVTALLWRGTDGGSHHDLEYYWKPAPKGYCPYCQRGINGKGHTGKSISEGKSSRS